jgi:hypothetical protein
VPLQRIVKEESSVPSSSRPPSRPRSHSSASKHESTHHSGRSPQGPIPRSRTKSEPQPPQAFQSSSPQDPRPRARSVVQSKRSSRSDSRPTGGEINRKWPMNSNDRFKRCKVRSPITDYELPQPQST